jgi:hypothetical protein
MRLRLASVFISLAGVLCSLAATPAAAAAAQGGAVVGPGDWYNSPGISAVPATQTYVYLQLTQVGVVIAGTNPSAMSDYCLFQGQSSSPETLASGTGSLSGSCSGAVFISCSSLRYDRAGTLLTLSSPPGGCGMSFGSTNVQVQTSGTCDLVAPNTVYGPWPPAYPYLTLVHFPAACELHFT